MLPNARPYVGFEGGVCVLVCPHVKKDANLTLAAV